MTRMNGRAAAGSRHGSPAPFARPCAFSPVAALLLALAFFASPPLGAQHIPTPESVLGFVPGSDTKLVEWPVLVQYYRALAEASDRVEYRELGRTTNGVPFVALVITSPENMARLDEIREINAQLADPRTIASDAERIRLLREGKTIVLITSSIHSTEVGGHLSPTVIAHRLASAGTPRILEILDQTVVLLVPSLNPDGVTIVSRWYNQTLGTPAEGTRPPELYHHYVGHDNNRDWYAFTQVETQLTVDSLHNVWHPQIVHDIHQQGQFGSRFFLPPFLDPVEPNVDPLIVSGFNTLGTYIAWEMTGQGKKGIVVSATYDAWTPARAYQHYHAGVRILSETASARLATPVNVAPGMLHGRRGFDARTASWNFPVPWEGGRWTLADIVDYQSSGALALLQHAAANRTVWLGNFLAIGERAVRGWDDWPYAFVIPRSGQNETALRGMLRILRRGAVEIRTARAAFEVADESYPAGTYVIVLRQPYAAFAKALLEHQDYPDLRLYPGGPPRPPYDVTAHTLPLLMGVEVATAAESIAVDLSDPVTIHAPRPRYDAVTSATAGMPRVGLYKSYTAAMDEGWTRWVFDTWAVPYESVVDSVIRAGDLRSQFDVIVIPRMSAPAIEAGLPESYPEPYAGGLGSRGVGQLARFVEDGGTLVTLDDASAWAIDAFDLPLRNTIDGLEPQEFYAPGSIFRLALDPGHPVSQGMPAQTIAWFQNSPTFEVLDSARVQVIGRYPEDPGDVLLSGWVLHPEKVAGKAALVEVSLGRGRVVLFGFRPQYRGQTVVTYPLLFNSLMRGTN
ncbi:MAG: peptidase M14 [Gemmatimonadetes bacterium]|nr:peptidase M14 [Gemmatimonadota bacterium]